MKGIKYIKNYYLFCFFLYFSPSSFSFISNLVVLQPYLRVHILLLFMNFAAK